MLKIFLFRLDFIKMYLKLTPPTWASGSKQILIGSFKSGIFVASVVPAALETTSVVYLESSSKIFCH